MKGFAGIAVAALCAASAVEAGCYPKDGYRPPKMTFEEKVRILSFLTELASMCDCRLAVFFLCTRVPLKPRLVVQ